MKSAILMIMIPMFVFARGNFINWEYIDSLKSDNIKIRREFISTVGHKIDSLRLLSRKLTFQVLNYDDFAIVKSQKSIDVFDKPWIVADHIGEIPPKTPIRLLALRNDASFFQIIYEDSIGFIKSYNFEAYENNKILIQTGQKFKLVEQYLNRISKEIAELEKIDYTQNDKFVHNKKQIEQELTVWVNVFKSNLHSSPNTTSDIVITLWQGDKLHVLDEQGTWLHVELDTWNGWIYSDYVSKQSVSQISIDDRRRREYVSNNPNLTLRQQSAILRGKIYIGMKKEHITASWGKPRDINRTVTSYGVSEQWIYESMNNRTYVYIENGFLTSWQD